MGKLFARRGTKEKTRPKSQLREWMESILPSTFIIVMLYMVFWPFLIHGDSMENSFYDGDRIVISRLMAWLGKIEQGDFVVCRISYNGDDENILKRVIGIPGDRIRLEDGSIYVNGLLLEEDYIDGDFTDGYIDLDLANNEYFVLGDNRAVSYDSRDAGAVDIRDIVGKVVAKWYPEFSVY